MLIRGPILNPRPDGGVDFIRDGLLIGDGRGRIAHVGAWDAARGASARRTSNIICPAMFDCHIHIPQHPIRGRFMEGVGPHPLGGRLMSGLNRNVFPVEARCSDRDYTRRIVGRFRSDTLSHGVIGGAAYMTVHPRAARDALGALPPTWQVGPVLMNQNCPEYLRTNESTLDPDLEALARDFGRRVIVTDRFAVAVSTSLRRRAVALARRLGLRMQTHLNEQIAEKQFVEQTLYPDARTYTDVYDRDGLLDSEPILAHCVRMSSGEFADVSRKSGACIAHCPTSNTLLGSGIMPLDELFTNGIDYAICTDVGASPTTSLLCEMAQFLRVHEGRSSHATPGESLYRTTLAAARLLGMAGDYGSLEIGKSMSFIEIDPGPEPLVEVSADEVIRRRVLRMQTGDHLAPALQRLERDGLDAGAELALLEADVAETAGRLDRVVTNVVVDGKPVSPDFQ